MKRTIILKCYILPILLLLHFGAFAQMEMPLAWQNITMQNGETITRVLLFSERQFVWTEYQTQNGTFLSTRGGHWTQDGDRLVFTFEFHTADTTMVGKSEQWLATRDVEGMLLHQNIAGRQIRWAPMPEEGETPLTGAWLMAGRKRDGEISRRDTNVPRKTMKLLTGNRFQWIAYNTETGQFFGTGGGRYEAKNGVYTEHIEFFSRDNSRVGMSLEFQFDVQDNDWHHSGKSSTGAPMYEIWANRKEL
ncbi:MAG TPA: hypothetical protein PKC76_06670 [Saprospiraceae bacterium]|nr:hypothetical protein [Saprospiraceae bacterium]HMP23795.1 hypothetical protein [Saprospiraceae bacterium]